MKKVLIILSILVAFCAGYFCGAGKMENVMKNIYLNNITDTKYENDEKDFTIVENKDGSLSIVNGNGEYIYKADEEEEVGGTKTWEIKRYINEFKEETDVKYINGVFDGTFSNSATTNSRLKVIVLIDDKVAFRIFEYGNLAVKNSSETFDDTYSIRILDANKKTHYYDGTMRTGSDRIYVDILNGEFAELLMLGDLKVYVENDERTTTNYLFTIEKSNFEEFYKN